MGRVIRWGTGMYKWEDQHGSFVASVEATHKIYIIGSRKVAIGALQPFYFMIKTYKSYKIDIDPPIVYIPGSRGKIL